MTKRIEKIWLEYHAKLLGYINSRVKNEAVAEDILQDVFVRVQTRINTLKQENSLGSWLYQITRNAIIDYYRAHKSMEELPESLAAPDAEPTEKARRDIESCLEPMIQNLPGKYRQALVLSELDDLPQKAVAESQGLSISGAKSRIQRGRALLKEMMLECCYFEYDHRGNIVDYSVKGDSCDLC
ncbi:MAG: RNA polymerase sigma factor SigZ [Gammaproteobacteria bacterium]|nr:RNA polymerase sigma factor SigZ [Gammaproteobacteria bacterium]